MLGYGYYYYLYSSIQYLTTLAARISAQTTGATIMRPPTAIGNTITTQIDATVKMNRLITRSHDPRERGGRSNIQASALIAIIAVVAIVIAVMAFTVVGFCGGIVVPPVVGGLILAASIYIPYSS